MDSQRPLPVTVYTPESSLASPATMLRDLIASRELAWCLAVRDTTTNMLATNIDLPSLSLRLFQRSNVVLQRKV